MAIVQMEKIRLFVKRSEASEALGVLQKMGIVHFTEISLKNNGLKKEEKQSFEFDYVSSRLDFVVNFLSRYEEAPFLKSAFEGSKVVTTEQEMEKLLKSFYHRDIIDKVYEIEEKLNNAKNKLESLKEEEKVLNEWAELSSPLSLNLETKFSKTVFLSGKPKEVDKIEKEIKEKFPLVHFKKVSMESFVLTFLTSEENLIKNILNDFKIEEVSLPKRKDTPKEELNKIVIEREKANQDTLQAEQEAKKLLKYLPKIKILSDLIRWKKKKHNLLTDTLATQDVLVFEGWCPEGSLPEMKESIAKKTSFFELELIKKSEDEQSPVEIKNKKTIRPFEAITRLYGLPAKEDLDPTPFLAGFFFLFFGFCLSDFGYGLFIFILTLVISLSFRLEESFKLFLRLIMFGGISSMFFGFIFGGYLGIDIQKMPLFLQKIQYFDPIASPLSIFYMALALGVIQVIFGVVLRTVKEARNNGLLDSVLNNVPWLFLFFSVGLLAASNFSQNLKEFLPVEAKWFVYLALIFIVVTQGRKESSIFKKIFVGILSIYSSVSYFADVLSYSRLLALGLATSALAFSVNLIAGMVGEMIPYVGSILAVVILIVGHTFNMAVNILGAFIHSARLQFVEFFGKFITGGGKKFEPFQEEQRYVIIKK